MVEFAERRRRGDEGVLCGVYALLANPVYIGRIRHKEASHPGQHAAIVEDDLWQDVQAQLKTNRQQRRRRAQAQSPSPLAGRLTDPDGQPMRPSHARKPSGARYRYYVSAALVEGSVATGATGWRIPAEALEAALARVLAARLRDPALASRLIGGDALPAEAAAGLPGRLAAAAAALDQPASAEARGLLGRLVTRVDLAETELRAEVTVAALVSDNGDARDAAYDGAGAFTIAAPIRLQRRGAELRLVLGESAAPARAPDPALVRLVVEARARLADYLDPVRCRGVSDLAEASGIDRADLARMMQLAFLAPDLVERILDGAQPVALTAQRLKRLGELPLDWEAQRRLLA